MKTTIEVLSIVKSKVRCIGDKTRYIVKAIHENLCDVQLIINNVAKPIYYNNVSLDTFELSN